VKVENQPKNRDATKNKTKTMTKTRTPIEVADAFGLQRQCDALQASLTVRCGLAWPARDDRAGGAPRAVLPR
jgi:hypothetical protein